MSKKNVDLDATLDPSDAEYEDVMLGRIADAMQELLSDARRQEIVCSISTPLLRYVRDSLECLDSIRRSGYFNGNKLPAVLATSIDNMAADYAQAMGGDNSLVNKLRTRQPARMNKH